MNNTDVNKLRNCWRKRFRDYYGKYHVVITTDLISRDLVKVFLRSKCIAGLIVIDPVLDIDPEQPLSHDGACPNPNSGIYARSCTDENAWNEMGVLCDVLEGVNIIAYLPPKIYEGPSPTQNDSYLMFAARMDSFGLIPEISPGEVSVVTSAIAVMAAAHVIGAHMNDFERAANSSNRRLIIAFFDGEAFDYIGSSSAAYSMS
ncbi:hypothetical protein OESDEN_09068 [Oesophagostomum dentatum]|uniref:Nicastrin n=1 Tax=Oesophagostomum dentatum TaxID=61180 RepID=A0A0B1T0J6_OESDE|nr:hypothetical protein OESDEN_09068 [Oesophagostomum dentatum]